MKKPGNATKSPENTGHDIEWYYEEEQEEAQKALTREKRRKHSAGKHIAAPNPESTKAPGPESAARSMEESGSFPEQDGAAGQPASKKKEADRKTVLPSRGKRKKRGRESIVTGAILTVLFLLMTGYFLWFEAAGKQEILINPLNNRTSNMARNVMKGDIVSSDGVVLATTQNAPDGTEYRLYPFGELFVHTLGYEAMGGARLERSQKIRLLTTSAPFWMQIREELLNRKIKGDTLHVTLDYRLSAYAREQLAGRNGAIAVMEPATGRILAMVSSPDFDPNRVSQEWSSLVSEENTTGNLLNRASQGAYAPGSTFKLITLLEFIRENPDTWRDFSYTCSGAYSDGTYTINCHEGHAHGTVDAWSALSLSCNGAFITMGKTLDPVKWKALADDFGYNTGEQLELEYRKSRFSMDAGADDWDYIQNAIGQGTTLTTPLLNLMITSAVANGGVMMKPYLIEGYTSTDGRNVLQAVPEVLRTCCTKEEAALLTEFLTGVVRDGSGYLAASTFCQVAGKTGSAQFSSQAGRYHAWFCGFAPAENPEIAVCVLIEDGGSGGEVAAPVAGRIFDYYFSLKTAENPSM